MAALADPCDRGRSRGRPDHVRRRRRAAPERVRAALARRLRGLAAGAGRQRGERAAPARRLRRGARLLLPGAPARPAASIRRGGRSSSACSTISPERGASRTTGIWEIRGERRHFVHSKAMAWVAFDRAVRTVEEHGFDGAGRPLADDPRRDPPGRLRARLRRRARLASRSRYGSQELDASLLLLPLVGFLPASDPRIRGTIEAVERELLHDGLRPPLPDAASPPPTGCRRARACSCRARSGSATATSCSAATTTRTSCSGGSSGSATISASMPRSTTRRPTRLLGNFPQAFTHLALVNTAFNLAPHLPSPMHRRHASRH